MKPETWQGERGVHPVTDLLAEDAEPEDAETEDAAGVGLDAEQEAGSCEVPDVAPDVGTGEGVDYDVVQE